MSTKLYVGNLPYQTTESDLQTLFEAIAPVDTINVVRDRATGRARGFGFVEMSDADGATRAISELDRRDYGGRSLTVNEAKPITDRAMAAAVDSADSAGNRARAPALNPDPDISRTLVTFRRKSRIVVIEVIALVAIGPAMEFAV
jgi:RNA recognition motif-containing protein